MMEMKMKLSNNIRLCLDVFRRRKWMVFHPVIFVVVLCVHVGLCVAAIGGTLASCSFDSQFRLLTLREMNSNFEYTLSIGKVMCIVFAAIMLVHGLFFFYSAQQYLVSRLTSLWY